MSVKKMAIDAKEDLAKQLLKAKEELIRVKQPIINKHELIEGTWTCKWCRADHPAFDMPCVDRYADDTLVG